MAYNGRGGGASRGKPSWQFDPKQSNIGLPKQLKCKGCAKVKDQDQYSNKQLGDLARSLRTLRNVNFKQHAHATCKFCTGGQRDEIECDFCGRVKGRNEFSKAQRTGFKDQMKCIACVTEYVKAKPIGEHVASDEDSDNSEMSNPYEDFDGVSLNENIANKSIQGTRSRIPEGYVQDRRPFQPGSASFAPSAARSRPSGNAATTTTTTATPTKTAGTGSTVQRGAFDKSAYGTPRTSTSVFNGPAPSVASSSRQVASGPPKTTNKFAKADNPKRPPEEDLIQYSDSDSDSHHAGGSDGSDAEDFPY